MTFQILTWCSVAAIFVVIFTVRCIESMRHHHKHSHNTPVSMGQEWEEIYVPGDRIIKDNDDSDDLDYM